MIRPGSPPEQHDAEQKKRKQRTSDEDRETIFKLHFVHHWPALKIYLELDERVNLNTIYSIIRVGKLCPDLSSRGTPGRPRKLPLTFEDKKLLFGLWFDLQRPTVEQLRGAFLERKERLLSLKQVSSFIRNNHLRDLVYPLHYVSHEDDPEYKEDRCVPQRRAFIEAFNRASAPKIYVAQIGFAYYPVRAHPHFIVLVARSHPETTVCEVFVDLATNPTQSLNDFVTRLIQRIRGRLRVSHPLQLIMFDCQNLSEEVRSSLVQNQFSVLHAPEHSLFLNPFTLIAHRAALFTTAEKWVADNMIESIRGGFQLALTESWLDGLQFSLRHHPDCLVSQSFGFVDQVRIRDEITAAYPFQYRDISQDD